MLPTLYRGVQGQRCQRKFASGHGIRAPCNFLPQYQCQSDNIHTRDLPTSKAIGLRPLAGTPCLCQTGREVPVQDPYAGRPLKRAQKSPASSGSKAGPPDHHKLLMLHKAVAVY